MHELTKNLTLRRRAFDATVKVGSIIVRWLVLNYFDVTLEGSERLGRGGPIIIAGNHPCPIDGLFLYLLSPLPLQFIVHRELFRHPLTAWFIRGMGFINASLHAETLHAAERTLQQGGILVIFPEGGPYEQGQMKVLAQGVALLARRTGAPVVPLGIAGSAEAYPLGSYFPRPGQIVLHLGAPITWAPSTAAIIAEQEIAGTLFDIRKTVQEARYAAVESRRRRPLRRWPARLRSALCGLALLPTIALVTAFARDLKMRPS